MKHYADSSYLLQLLVADFATPEAISLHRRLGRPAYAFCSWHELEVANALRLRLFASKSLASAARKHERLAVARGLNRLSQNLLAGRFVTTKVDHTAVIRQATLLSNSFTEQLGARSLDILHVATALVCAAGAFLTCDQQQAKLAKAAGLKTHLVGA